MDKIDQLEKMESVIFKLYNCCAQLIFLKNKIKYRQKLKKNYELCKISKDTCIICGNGPSLGEFRFDLLKGYPIFTVNYFFEGNIEGFEGSTYHVMIDHDFYKPAEFNRVIATYKQHPETKFILRLKAQKELEKRAGTDHAYFINEKLIQYSDYVKCDMTKNRTACANVILACIQCALFMGYKKIYLIGCESDFVEGYRHFYDQVTDNIVNKWGNGLRWVDMAFKHYNALETFAKKHEVEIVNITPNSFIDAFQRMALEDFYQTMGI